MQKQNKGTRLFVFYVILGCLIKLDLTAVSAVIVNLTIEPVKTTAVDTNSWTEALNTELNSGIRPCVCVRFLKVFDWNPYKRGLNCSLVHKSKQDKAQT